MSAWNRCSKIFFFWNPADLNFCWKVVRPTVEEWGCILNLNLTTRYFRVRILQDFTSLQQKAIENIKFQISGYQMIRALFSSPPFNSGSLCLNLFGTWFENAPELVRDTTYATRSLLFQAHSESKTNGEDNKETEQDQGRLCRERFQKANIQSQTDREASSTRAICKTAISPRITHWTGCC